MGIEIVVEDEQGIKIASLEDPTNILHRVLPPQDDSTFQCLNRIDWYGDTSFNRHQVADVRQELKRLVNVARSVEEAEFLGRLDRLAERTEAGPHLYLKFYGD